MFNALREYRDIVTMMPSTSVQGPGPAGRVHNPSPEEATGEQPVCADGTEALVLSNIRCGIQECLAWGCNGCGKQFHAGVFPRGNYPNFNLLQCDGVDWHVAGPSVPVVLLPFDCLEDMMTTWHLLSSVVSAQTHAWWSTQCRQLGTALPFTTHPFEVPESMADRSTWGNADCCLLLIADSSSFTFQGTVSDTDVMERLQMWFGCVAKHVFAELIKHVRFGASVELVTLSGLKSWMRERKSFLLGTQYELVEAVE